MEEQVFVLIEKHHEIGGFGIMSFSSKIETKSDNHMPQYDSLWFYNNQLNERGCRGSN